MYIHCIYKTNSECTLIYFRESRIRIGESYDRIKFQLKRNSLKVWFHSSSANTLSRAFTSTSAFSFENTMGGRIFTTLS